MATAVSLPVPLPAAAAPGLYMHIPFCRYVCPYCDFNVYAGQGELIPAYVDALAAELALYADAYPNTRDAATIFIGGGTPSLLSPGQIERLIDAAASTVGVDGDAEVTMESNPDNLTVDYCRELLAAGVNRLSIGVQSLQSPGLKVLGRLHGAAGAAAAYHAARDAGFTNISLDFIYGWPDQTRAELDADVDTILEWDAEHVSLYALIVEQGTPLSTAVRRGQLLPVDDDTVASYYDHIVERLGGRYEHYEISNWARDANARSIHNQIYWQNGRYYGAGAGAHGFLGDTRMSNLRLPASYIESVHSGELPIAMTEEIDPELSASETLMLGLRLLRDGVSAVDFETRHGTSLQTRFGTLIDRFLALELLEFRAGRLRLTERGALVSNSILAEFLP